MWVRPSETFLEASYRDPIKTCTAVAVACGGGAGAAGKKPPPLPEQLVLLSSANTINQSDSLHLCYITDPPNPPNPPPLDSAV